MWQKGAMYMSWHRLNTARVLSCLQGLALLLVACLGGGSCMPLLQRENLTKQLRGDWLVDNPSLQADTVYLVRKSKQAWCVQQKWSFQADQTLRCSTTDHCKNLTWTTTQVYHLQIKQPRQLILLLSRPAAYSPTLIQQGSIKRIDTLHFRILNSKAGELRLVRQDNQK